MPRTDFRSMTFPVRQPPETFEKVDDKNLKAYDRADVAAHYASLDYLSDCEKMLFDTFLKPGDAILDLGVGGGRTTPYLSHIASRYVGVDYAPAMVAACRQKFPHLQFLVADGANLARLGDQSFDSVVMAFNGIDALVPDESRRRCLGEICRVLKNGGVLIFSSHNPRAVFLRPAWNPRKIERVAKMLAGRRNWLFGPARWMLLGLRVAAALVRSAIISVLRLGHRMSHRAFWSGCGYMMDSSHGGLLIHYSVPQRVIEEVEPHGFQFLRLAGDDYPRPSWVSVTEWYYYVFQKVETPVGSRCG